MDENFIIELVKEGEKKFSFEVPLSMSFTDALSNLKGTADEVVQASAGWKDQGGLRTAIALEAETWRGIFEQARQVTARSDLSVVTTLGEDDNAGKLLALAESGNKVMKHFFVSGQPAADALRMYFVFRVMPGPRFEASVDFA